MPHLLTSCVAVLASLVMLPRAAAADGAAAQTLPAAAPAPAPAEEDPAATEAFSPFRDWWYRGARRPPPDSPEIRRLLAFLETHPGDPEAIWWITKLQRYRNAPQIDRLPDLIRAAADKGHPLAMVALAQLLLEGKAVPADRERAMPLLRATEGEADVGVERADPLRLRVREQPAGERLEAGGEADRDVVGEDAGPELPRLHEARVSLGVAGGREVEDGGAGGRRRGSVY
jgi:hypothetical protein